MSESSSAAVPRTTWEYCHSGAERIASGQLLPGDERHGQLVLLLAAVIAGCADEAELVGAEVGRVPVDGPGGLLELLRSRARLAVQACSALPGLGAEQRSALLALDRGAFQVVQALADDTLVGHLMIAGGRAPTVREAANATIRVRVLKGTQAALGRATVG
ncbi:hypothetical protein ACIRVF_42205 [Kitasatospora sp. NPDC101157]|uniref:hypothetical protein n=1 Tax=Kitasatospora sp. NPDC101157 TaxID=3364098 RepID=UPI003820BCFA